MKDNKSEDSNLYNQKYFLLYGGQGAPYINELRQLYHTNQKFDSFFEKTFNILQEVRDEILPDDKFYSVYKYGLELKSWLENPSKAPSDSYLQDSMVSVPIMFTTQAGNYLRFIESIGGFDKKLIQIL